MFRMKHHPSSVCKKVILCVNIEIFKSPFFLLICHHEPILPWFVMLVTFITPKSVSSCAEITDNFEKPLFSRSNKKLVSNQGQEMMVQL